MQFVMHLKSIGRGKVINMAHYTIHACPKRMWYVEEYLLPSMREQGIKDSDILVWNDKNRRGNMRSFVNSMQWAKCDSWHLQDDIIIARNFREKTEEYDEGVVAGFVTSFDLNYWNAKAEDLPIGEVPIKNVWWSFQCIRIPKQCAKEFAEWWYKIAVNDGAIISKCINKNKNDDWAFYKWIKAYHPDITAVNLKPNIVDHIDYMLGGSIINKERGNRNVGSLFFDDIDLVEQLERKLNESSKKAN